MWIGHLGKLETMESWAVGQSGVDLKLGNWAGWSVWEVWADGKFGHLGRLESIGSWADLGKFEFMRSWAVGSMELMQNP